MNPLKLLRIKRRVGTCRLPGDPDASPDYGDTDLSRACGTMGTNQIADRRRPKWWSAASLTARHQVTQTTTPLTKAKPIATELPVFASTIRRP
jgi:hypothetical protein